VRPVHTNLTSDSTQVRERALRLLACLALHASAPPPATCPVKSHSPQAEGPNAGREEREESREVGRNLTPTEKEGYEERKKSEEREGQVAYILWHLCTSKGIVKDVLSAFTVSRYVCV